VSSSRWIERIGQARTENDACHETFPLALDGESPEALGREIRLAAAIHLYGRGLVSHGKGATFAGHSRWEFIQALGRADVPACQTTADELNQEVKRAYE
jgi:predicted HTH domain antitoxin